MMDRIKPYPSTVDSGVSWLGNIPKQWDCKHGFIAYREKQEKNKGLIENTVLSLSYGRIVIKPTEKLHGLVPESFETYQIVNPGDIIIRPTDLQNDWNSLRVGLAQNRGIITSAYICLRTTGLLSSEYGYYLLHTYDLKKIFYGLGSGLRQNLGFEDFKRMPVLIPPKDEQAAIVRFLKYINRQCDRYIREKKKLIGLLNEQKQAIIHRAVTRGLNPNVKLKPSGIPWLGDIPAHWSVRRIRKCICNVKSGIWGTEPTAKNADEHIICVRVADFDMEKFSISKNKLTVRAIPKKAQQSRILRRGDLLIEKSGGGDAQPVGRVVQFNLDVPAVSSNFISRIRPLENLIVPTFLLYIFQSLQHRRRNLFSIKQTTGIQNLDEYDYFSNFIAFPGLDEQREIIRQLAPTLNSIVSIQAELHKEIELIREYRISLIADVVTGKLDIRKAAENLPDEPIEQSADETGTQPEDELAETESAEVTA